MDVFSESMMKLCAFGAAISIVKIAIGFFFGWLAYKSGKAASQVPPTN